MADETRSKNGETDSARPGAAAEADKACDAQTQTGPAGALPGIGLANGSGSGSGSGHKFSETALPHDLPGYQFTYRLGQGGMGTVWRGIQLSTHRPVAIKLMNEATFGSEHARLRFAREVELTARLNHPHIARIYDSGLHQGMYFYAMELVEGDRLDVHIRERKLDQSAVLGLMILICRAVQHAHERGIIHRDLKPANILVSPDGQPHVLDFGLAKSIDFQEGLSLDGAIAGTPAYMSPEQAAGESSKLDARTDVYSLGSILYAILAGQPAHDPSGTNFEVLRRIIEEDVRRPPIRMDRGLEAILLKALARNPDHRYACAGQLADDLEHFLNSEPMLAKPPSVFYTARRIVRRHRLKLAFCAAAMIALGTLVILGFQSRRTGRISQLDRTLRAGIDAPEMSVARLSELEETALALEKTSRAHADARERLYRRFAAQISRAIQTPVLQSDLIAQIESDLLELEIRAPHLVPALRQKLAERKGIWQPVFEVRAPFENWTKWIPEEIARNEADALVIAPPDTPGKTVLTRVNCEGAVQLEAEVAWDAGTEAAPQAVGLVLNGSREMAYIFTADAENIEIRRGATVLASQHRSRLHENNRFVRLVAWREGEKLGFQLNNEPPLRSEDVFSIVSAQRGSYGLWAGATMKVKSLRASRQLLSPASSPMEKGDLLYSKSQWAGAKAEYESQLATADEAFRPEARFKIALCQLKLGQRTEARDLFMQVSEGPGTRWPRLAEFHLCMMATEKLQYAEADMWFQRLEANSRLGEGYEQLAAIVPQETRNQLLALYKQEMQAFFTRRDVGAMVAQRLDKLIRAQEVLARDAHELARWQTYSMIGLNRLGCYRESVQLAERILRKPLPEDCQPMFQPAYGEAMRLTGRSAEFLNSMERFFPDRSREQPYTDRPQCERLSVLRETARAHIALGDWAAAERDIEDLFRLVPRQMHLDFCKWPVSCVLRGAIREHRGDTEGAMAAWRMGVYKSVKRTDRGDSPALETAGLQSASIPFYCSIIGGLTHEWTDLEAELCFNALMEKVSRGGESPAVFLVTSVLNIPKSLVYTFWDTPRGRELVRHFAFMDLPIDQLEREFLVSMGTEWLRGETLKRELKDYEEETLRRFLEQMLGLYRNGKIGKAMMVEMGAVWAVGATGRIGWGGVAPKLPPEVRGLTAYVMGLHWNAAGDRNRAEFFFKAAIENAGQDPALERCAREAIGK